MLKKIYKLTSFEIKNIFTNKNTPFSIKRGVFFDIKFYLNKSEKEKIKEKTKEKDKEKDIESEKSFLFKTGIVASSKIFKTAVERNKIRRRVYSILEKYRKENKNLNIFLIIYLKKEVKDLEFSILEKEVYNTLNNIIK